MRRLSLVVVSAASFALLNGCGGGLPSISGLAPASGPGAERQLLARAFDIRPNAAAEPPLFLMPSPDKYDDGYMPTVTFAKPGTLVEEHSAYSGYLWTHVGAVDGATVSWNASHQYDDGVDPSVTSDGKGAIFEVHRGGTGQSKLYYRFGTLDATHQRVSWLGSQGPYAYGYKPDIAFSGSDTIVEAQSDITGLGSWRVATIAGGKATWHTGGTFTDGYHPSVAANNKRIAIEIERSGTYRGDYFPTFYRVGHIDASAGSVTWGARHEIVHELTAEPEAFSSVALDDAGNVIDLYVCEWPSIYTNYTDDGYGWCTVSGTLGSDGLIDWHGEIHNLAPPDNYNAGQPGLISPSVTTMNGVAVGVAQQGHFGLYYGTTLLTDRSNWMGDRLTTTLKGKSLRQIVIPGSHDAGMYKGNSSFSGVAQSQDFYEQLTGGQRYFDIRPDKELYAWHGPGQGYGVYIRGASIQSILDGVRHFMDEGHREVVVLKFSHWGGFTPSTAKNSPYEKLVSMVTSTLGPYLYAGGTRRLADTPLTTMVPPAQTHGVVLPVFDLPASFSTAGATGLYTYRDWDSNTVIGTQFTVYDQYSKTIVLSEMQGDQLDKLAAFNGKMENLPDVPCDLFLLSWTLTPAAAIRASAAEADATLAPEMSHVRRNKQGFIPNVLFVDFYSWADPADTAIVQNARF